MEHKYLTGNVRERLLDLIKEQKFAQRELSDDYAKEMAQDEVIY